MGIILFFVIRGALRIKNISDYAIGNIVFSPTTVALSLAASMTSAATFVINPGFIANYGISGIISYGIVLPLAAVISLAILTKSFRKYGQSVKALTLAQWIGERYKSRNYALFMGFLALLLITFIVLIAVAITQVLSKALNADPYIVLIATVVFIFGYMMFGGANSMVYTNTIQAIIMIIVAVILLTSGYEHFSEGIGQFMRKLAAIDPALTKATNPASLLFRDFYEIIFAQAIVGIAIVVQPHIITKSLLLKKESDVNKYLFVAIATELLFFSIVITGLYARITFPDLTAGGVTLKNDTIIPTYVMQIFSDGNLAVVIGLIVVLGLLSAGISTLEGLIQSVSTTITSDIIKPLTGNWLKTDKAIITLNRIVIILIGIVTIWLSWQQIAKPKLSVGIFAQNGVYAYFASAFVPVIFGIYYQKMKASVALAGSAIAFSVHFIVYYLMPYFVNSHNMTFGFFTRYLEGPVRNPAIACSTAVVISTIAVLIMILIDKSKTEKTAQS
ncbi:MAG: sodium:solute symporter [Lentimicrobium sp.]|nr:sodium:solute symporter [Lentimicrobium sp.]